MAASEARALGYGGVSLVHRACGLSRKVIARGIREIEAGIFSMGSAPGSIFLEHSKELERLTLYESRINRNLQRNLAQLKSLQTERKAERARQMAEARLLAQVNLAQNLAYHPELDGFVFSAPEINAAIDRNNRLQLAKTALSASRHQTRQDPPPLTIGTPSIPPKAF